MNFELHILTKVCKYKALGTHFVGWMDSRDSLGTVEKRKYLSPAGKKSIFLQQYIIIIVVLIGRAALFGHNNV
jgi:hypothetical protein